MIREYRTEDRAQLEECYVELQDAERVLDPVLEEGRVVVERYLEQMFRECAEAEGEVFVAEEDGRVVGFVCVWAKVASKAVEEKQYEYSYVSDLVVLPGYRRRGLGRALLQTAEDYALGKGATILRLFVMAKNTGAKTLYESFGFEERIIAMWKDLPARD
ncbi:MAG TPA: GNAT family N-acetyltransferase [Pyrinomonadaceae bacterium]|jgi:ribosomal protein S18 acetylase RimI-like enzyme